MPNNPSLILDTALWKTGESATNAPDETSSPLVHLQPILVETTNTTNNNNDENFFLTSEEGMFEFETPFLRYLKLAFKGWEVASP